MPQELISIAEARRRVLAAVAPLGTERVPVADALDRVLAKQIVAAADVPPFPSSAMDGYAVEPGPAGRDLRVAGESRAGSPSEHSLGAGEAIRISTGAAVPTGAAAVIRQEDTDEHGDTVDAARRRSSRARTSAPAGEVHARRGTDARAPARARRRRARRRRVAAGGGIRGGRPPAAGPGPVAPATSCATPASRWSRVRSTTRTRRCCRRSPPRRAGRCAAPAGRLPDDRRRPRRDSPRRSSTPTW